MSSRVSQQAINKWLGKITYPGPPYTSQAGRSASRHIKIELPRTYLHFLRFVNGGHPSKNYFVAPHVANLEIFQVSHFYHISREVDEYNAVRHWQQMKLICKTSYFPIAEVTFDRTLFIGLSGALRNKIYLYPVVSQRRASECVRISSNLCSFLRSLEDSIASVVKKYGS